MQRAGSLNAALLSESIREPGRSDGQSHGHGVRLWAATPPAVPVPSESPNRFESSQGPKQSVVDTDSERPFEPEHERVRITGIDFIASNCCGDGPGRAG